MDWTALSLDMNSLANIWGNLAKDVYAKIRHFATIQDLKLQFE